MVIQEWLLIIQKCVKYCHGTPLEAQWSTERQWSYRTSWRKFTVRDRSNGCVWILHVKCTSSTFLVQQHHAYNLQTDNVNNFETVFPKSRNHIPIAIVKMVEIRPNFLIMYKDYFCYDWAVNLLHPDHVESRQIAGVNSLWSLTAISLQWTSASPRVPLTLRRLDVWEKHLQPYHFRRITILQHNR